MQILTEHKDKLETLAEALILKESLDDDEIRDLLGFEKRSKGIH